MADTTTPKLAPTQLHALRNFDELPDAGFVSDSVVAALIGVTRQTVWKWAGSRLPAPIRRGGITRWNVGDLRTCIAKWDGTPDGARIPSPKPSDAKETCANADLAEVSRELAERMRNKGGLTSADLELLACVEAAIEKAVAIAKAIGSVAT